MLFSETVYGPIHSRRLGISLGVNLMPNDAKLCSFNCLYCECGFNHPVLHPHLPAREEVRQALHDKLLRLQKDNITPDVITFSGNGEPTMHPDFLDIIRDTCSLRNQYFPQAKIAVLSNSTQLCRQDVVEALWLVDNRILKLDSGIDHTMRLMDQPVNTDLTVRRIVELLQQFDGDFTLQTCFLTGEYNGETVDNTTEEELQAWYKLVRELHPKQIMMYVIDRQTPVSTLQKVDCATMHRIAAPLQAEGVDVVISC